MKAPTTMWTRMARRLGFDHNPLRRRSDLVEAWLLPVMLVAFLTLCPLVAGGAGAWVRADNSAVRQAQRSWHQVHAVLLQAAPGPMMSDNGANTWLVWAPARWTVDGRLHVGDVPADAGARAGSTVPVWLNRAGSVQTPPMTAGQVADRVTVAAASAIMALAFFLAGLGLLARRILDRRRLRRWEAAWLSVGPQWTRHSRPG